MVKGERRAVLEAERKAGNEKRKKHGGVKAPSVNVRDKVGLLLLLDLLVFKDKDGGEL